MMPLLRRHRGDDLWSRIDRQLADPKGLVGGLLGRLMILLNRSPNRQAVAALAPQVGDTILEVGFGPGQAIGDILAAAPGCRLHGIDRSAEMVNLARRRNRHAGSALDLRVGNLSALPWRDASFDKVLAVNVAYFFDGDGIAARELYRVLRPGGLLVLYVTDRETMASWRLAGPETHRLYGKADIETMLFEAGFEPGHIRLTAISLPLGMKGWIAMAERSALSSIRRIVPEGARASAS